MYNDRITLTMQDILEKEFKIDARGYRLQEVDKFLDVIIKDYNEYNNIIKNLEKEKERLEKSITRRKTLLSNPNYISKAPENIVNKEKEDLEKELNQLEIINNKLN